MDGGSRSKERRIVRERNMQQRSDPPESLRNTPSPGGNLRLNLGLMGSEMEFKKFEKLLGDSLERVQSLRKVGLTAREQPPTNHDKQQLGEYFLPAARSKQTSTEAKLPKSSMLSVAETQLTYSGMYESTKQPNPESDASYTVYYLLNENKHLKYEIYMILKSRGKLNETELLVRKISEYRRLISEQEAEISLLKKYNIVLSKEVERTKAELQATTCKLESIKIELAGHRQSSNCKELRISQHHTSLATTADIEQIGSFLEKLRSTHRKSQVIQDLLSCLEKEIYWNSRYPRSNIPPSPHRAK